jgi:hypothetical protein
MRIAGIKLPDRRDALREDFMNREEHRIEITGLGFGEQTYCETPLTGHLSM